MGSSAGGIHVSAKVCYAAILLVFLCFPSPAIAKQKPKAPASITTTLLCSGQRQIAPDELHEHEVILSLREGTVDIELGLYDRSVPIVRMDAMDIHAVGVTRSTSAAAVFDELIISRVNGDLLWDVWAQDDAGYWADVPRRQIDGVQYSRLSTMSARCDVQQALF